MSGLKERRPQSLSLAPLNTTARVNRSRGTRPAAQPLPPPVAEDCTPSSATPFSRFSHDLSRSTSTVDLIDGEDEVVPNSYRKYNGHYPKSPIVQEEGGRESSDTLGFELSFQSQPAQHRGRGKDYAVPPEVFTCAGAMQTMDSSSDPRLFDVIQLREQAAEGEEEELPFQDGYKHSKHSRKPARSASEHSIYKPHNNNSPFHKSSSARNFRRPSGSRPASFCDSNYGARPHPQGGSSHSCINIHRDSPPPSSRWCGLKKLSACHCGGVVAVIMLFIVAVTIVYLASNQCLFGCAVPAAPAAASTQTRCWSVQELKGVPEYLVNGMDRIDQDQLCTKNMSKQIAILKALIQALSTSDPDSDGSMLVRDNSAQVFLGTVNPGGATMGLHDAILGWTKSGDAAFIGSNILTSTPGHFHLQEGGLYQVFLHLGFRNPDSQIDTAQEFSVSVKRFHQGNPGLSSTPLLHDVTNVKCHVTGTQVCHSVMIQGLLRLRKDDQLYVVSNQIDSLERHNAENGHFGIVFVSKD